MNLAAFFILVAALQVSAKSYSQERVTVNFENIRLSKALKEVEKKSTFHFVYSNFVLTDKSRITLQARNIQVIELLEKLLENTGLTFSVMNNNLVVIKEDGEVIQDVIVKGNVTDKTTGKPLAGASIQIKGSNAGTTTDVNGNYSLNVPNDAVLVISSVGYSQMEISVNGRQEINITLEPITTGLNEVVVVGYGTAKRKDLTGAIATVSGEDIDANLAQTAGGAIQGRIAGVTVANVGGQPGSGMSINIRGLSSLGSNTPLYVIDGVYGDIDMVDPDDIASITVLKDASAAAIYGSRAANGVVLITTKSGRRNSPARIGLSAYTGVQTITKKLSVMNAQQWITTMKPSGFLPQSALDFQGNGTNWQDEIYHTAPMNKVNLNVSGGGANTTYDVSAGYLDQQGILRTTGYKAFNFRTKNTFNFFNNHVRLGNTLLVKTSDKKYSDFTITDALRQNPLIPVLDSNQLGGYAPWLPWMKNLDNPVGYLNLHDWHTYETDLFLNAFAEVDLGLKGLKYVFNFGLNRTTGRNYQANDAYNFGSGVIKSFLGEGAYFDNQWLAENTLHYDNDFGKHSISFLAGFSSQSNSNRNFGASRNNIPEGTDAIGAGSPTEQLTSGGLQEYSLESMFSRLMYSYDSRYLFTASVRRDGSSRFAPGHRFGTFPSLAVGWNIMNEKFFAPLENKINVLKLRGSYGKLGNQEIGNYATQSTVTSGINYVEGSGSSETWWQGASTGINWVSPIDLTWEETRTSNVGLDAAFLESRLSMSFDYYNRETRNILLGINMPPSAGLGGVPTMNAGTISNKGFELTLQWKDKIGKVEYNVGVNAAKVSNEVKAVTVGNIQQFPGYNPQGEGTITWAKVGYPIGGFWVVKTDGIFQSDADAQNYKNSSGQPIQPGAQAGDVKFIDFNNDGAITDDDRQYVGSPFPKLAYGINGGLSYQAFDFSFFFDGMYGNKIYNYTRARMESTNEIINFSTKILDAWTPTNTNTDIPRFTTSDPNTNWRRVSDRWIESGSFLRLRTVQLGYTLQGKFLQRAGISRGRIYVSGENVFTITKYQGYTPDLGQNDNENGGGSGTMTAGTDHGRFPIARSVSFGLQATF